MFQKDTAGGGESNQLFRYDAATGALTLLTDGKSRNGIPVVSRSGRVAFDSTRRDGKNRDLYVLDPRGPKGSTMIAESFGLSPRAVFAKSGPRTPSTPTSEAVIPR